MRKRFLLVLYRKTASLIFVLLLSHYLLKIDLIRDFFLPFSDFAHHLHWQGLNPKFMVAITNECIKVQINPVWSEGIVSRGWFIMGVSLCGTFFFSIWIIFVCKVCFVFFIQSGKQRWDKFPIFFCIGNPNKKFN